jgi:glycosyltransferase involved in cell wall biosynthesis
MPKDKYVVLSRGIPEPPSLPIAQTRNRVRSNLGISDSQILVLSIGRIARSKGGVYELFKAVSLAASRHPSVTCVLVGSLPALDETNIVQKGIDSTSILRDRVKLLPPASPIRYGNICALQTFSPFQAMKAGKECQTVC